LSDFRHNEWTNPTELKQLMREIDEASEQIQFVNCAPEDQQSNLAVVDVRPADEIRAAGVPLQVLVTVANFGTETALKVPLRIRTIYYDPQRVAGAEPGQAIGHAEEPPAVLIDELAPGQTTTRQVQVFFPRPGEHVVEASLPDDVVLVDNRRWSVVKIDDAEPVLAIDGDSGQRNAYYLKSVFEPGARATTGVRVEVKPAAFLRDALPDALAEFRAIYLLDVDRLEDRAVENLEEFVRGGGGLGIFVGENVQRGFYTTRLYRDGAGVLPLPLERDPTLLPDPDESVPDFEVIDHPLFSVFLGERNPFIRLVKIDKYLSPRLSWTPDPDSTVSVLARLRNRQPLVVERRFGEGRVVTFLTTLAPNWNNWANDPSFVVVLLKLQSYLASPLRPVEQRLVGSTLALTLDPDKYRPDVVFVAPGPKPDLPLLVQRTAISSDSAPPGGAKPARREPPLATLPGTSADDANASRSGVYEVWQSTIAGPPEVRRFAFNVDPAESDITQSSGPMLVASVAPVEVRVRRADEFAFELTEHAGMGRGTWLIILLIFMLLAEQLVAYFASYHPAAKGVARA
jgi:hypothetical protein